MKDALMGPAASAELAYTPAASLVLLDRAASGGAAMTSSGLQDKRESADAALAERVAELEQAERRRMQGRRASGSLRVRMPNQGVTRIRVRMPNRGA